MQRVFMFCILALIVSLSAPAQSIWELKVLPRVTVSVLVDNMAGWDGELGEWGLAYLIECGRHQIILDTGGGRALPENARMMKADLTAPDAVVISHGHEDHTGGLNDLLDVRKVPNLFMHPAVFETRYVKGSTGPVPMTFPMSRGKLVSRVGKFVETTVPTQIQDGIMVTGQIPRLTDFEDTGLSQLVFLDSGLTKSDPILDDQAVFFRVPEGIVILLGCGHSGLVNTMAYVSKLTGDQTIYAVMGGTHLLGASSRRMQMTIDALRKYKVQKILLSHCTGIQAYAQFASAFPGQCSWPASGTVVVFGGEKETQER